jgi:hypothetical protein
MTIPDENTQTQNDRRRFQRYYPFSRIMLAIEDESLKESIGIGEPGDISLGGVRVRNLPSSSNVRVGDRLVLLLLDTDDALSLKGEVVHHATLDTFGVVFADLSLQDQRAVGNMIERLHSRL